MGDLLQQLPGLQAADELAARKDGGEAGGAGGFEPGGVDMGAEGDGAAEDFRGGGCGEGFRGDGGGEVEAEQDVGVIEKRGGGFEAGQAAEFKAGMVRGMTRGADQHQVRGEKQ